MFGAFVEDRVFGNVKCCLTITIKTNWSQDEEHVEKRECL